jgi:L-amino acid N-acyltransferase YncA
MNTDLGNVDRASIGPATDADVEGLFQIYLDVVTAGGAEPRTDAPLREVFAEGWIQQRRVYAASRDGVTVGGYFLRTNFPAFAAHIAQGGYLVARAARRQGLGRRLLEHSLAEATRVGYRAMMFNLVMADNPSRGLYESSGFRVVGRIPRVHGDEAGLIYWRDLAANGKTSSCDA